MLYVVYCSEVSGGPLVIGQVSSINRNASNSGQLASTSYSLSPDNVPQTFLITSHISVVGDFLSSGSVPGINQIFASS